MQTDGRAEAEGRGGMLKSISSVKKTQKTCFCLSFVLSFSVSLSGSSSEEGAGGSAGRAVGAGEDRG